MKLVWKAQKNVVLEPNFEKNMRKAIMWHQQTVGLMNIHGLK